MLTELTPAQAALLPAIRDEWIAHALSTAPADRGQAERGVRLAYAAAGLTPPKVVVWVDSPLEGVVCFSMLRAVAAEEHGNNRSTRASELLWELRSAAGNIDPGGLRDYIWDALGRRAGNVGYALERHVQGEFREGLDNPAWASAVWRRALDRMRPHVGDALADRVEALDTERVRFLVTTWLAYAFYEHAQHDYGWLAVHDAFARFGVTTAARLDGLFLIARSCGCWWPLADAVVLSERPTVLTRDAQGRLHNESGPAVGYPDGFVSWAWHGIRVPREAIETDALTTEQIDRERNVEVRRVMIERYGLARYLRDVRAWLSHGDEHGMLWRVAQGEHEPLVAVQVFNSTAEPDGSRREYFLRVPPEMRTAREAVAWTFGLEADEYEVAIES